MAKGKQMERGERLGSRGLGREVGEESGGGGDRQVGPGARRVPSGRYRKVLGEEKGGAGKGHVAAQGAG